MNYWTEVSIELANQRNYLDLLSEIYPMSINPRREISQATKEKIEYYFNEKDDINLLLTLLQQELFPIKDSYVAFLRKDNSAIHRNPSTVNRLVEFCMKWD